MLHGLLLDPAREPQAAAHGTAWHDRPPCAPPPSSHSAGGLAVKQGLPVDNQHACEVRPTAVHLSAGQLPWVPAACAAVCCGLQLAPACPVPAATKSHSHMQYYLAKEEGANVEEMLAALAPKLPASLDGGI